MLRLGNVIGLVVGGLLGGLGASAMHDQPELGGATVPFLAAFGALVGWMAGFEFRSEPPAGGAADAEPGAAADGGGM